MSFFTTQLLWYLFSSNITYFLQKCKFSDFPLLRIKFTKIFHVIFQIKSQFFFKLWIFFQCHETEFFCTFQVETLCAIGTCSISKYKFPDMPLLALKFAKFLMSFLERRVSFSSKFTSPFSVMRHNASVLLHLNICMLWTKGSNQSANIRTFNCSYES